MDHNDKSKLKDLLVLQGLTEDELSRVASFLHPRFVASGVTFLTQGLSGTGVFVLRQGTVKVCVLNPGGHQVMIALCGPGDVLGEMDAIDPSGHSASAVTIEPCQFLWMSPKDFNSCVDTIPRLGRNLLSRLVARERSSTNRSNALAHLSLEGRVARQLLLLSRQYGFDQEDGSVQLKIRPTQAEIAALVGSSRGCVNRVIKHLKENNLLIVHRDGTLVLPNIEPLCTLCHGWDQ